jgi:hypothetical protein
MNNEFIEPTRESRRNLLLLIAVVAVSGGLIKFWLMPAFFAHIATLPRCDQIVWLRNTVLAVLATPPVMALWSVPHSLRLLKLNQSPLPGTWVFRRTPVRRGRSVRIQACFLLALSVAMLAFPVVGMHLLRSTLFAPSPKICTR